MADDLENLFGEAFREFLSTECANIMNGVSERNLCCRLWNGFNYLRGPALKASANSTLADIVRPWTMRPIAQDYVKSPSR
jgi:hypothetical protein